jgi:hypothetical protein
MIFLEGADGVGKSTLADAIEAEFDGPVVRINNGPPPTDIPPYLHYDIMLDDLIEISETGTLVVVDRFHVGEIVYANLLRGGSNLSMNEAREIDERIVANGGKLVHCWLPLLSILKRQVERDGGIPDKKSGAGMSHAGPIASGFMRCCGDLSRLGAISPYWYTQDMRGYPSWMAKTILSSFRDQTN